MASISLNLFPAPQPSSHSRKLVETTSSSSSSLVYSRRSRGNTGGLKPIVVTGNPPTFVSAPDRRIVAGSVPFCYCFSDARFCSTHTFSSYCCIYSAVDSSASSPVYIRIGAQLSASGGQSLWLRKQEIGQLNGVEILQAVPKFYFSSAMN